MLTTSMTPDSVIFPLPMGLSPEATEELADTLCLRFPWLSERRRSMTIGIKLRSNPELDNEEEGDQTLDLSMRITVSRRALGGDYYGFSGAEWYKSRDCSYELREIQYSELLSYNDG